MLLTAEDLGVTVRDDFDVQALLDQQNEGPDPDTGEPLLTFMPEQIYAPDEAKVVSSLAGISYMDEKNMSAPENARLKLKKNKKAFTAVEQSKGNTLDTAAVQSAVIETVRDYTGALNLEELGVYQKAAFAKESEGYKDFLKQANAFLDVRLTYDFGEGGKEVISAETIAPWVYPAQDGTMKIDQKKVKAYVNKIAKKHKDEPIYRQFRTHDGNLLTRIVPDDDATLDTAALVKDIVKCLNKKKSGQRVVPYKDGEVIVSNNFGGNYVEIDLNKQVLYLYKKGKCILETNITSGNVRAGHTTPPGIYRVYSMETHVVLRGDDYASPVTFWMPFNGGIGLHAAPWRSTFGGDYYLYDGSHGCINLSYKGAEKIYNTIHTGWYVVLYYDQK